MNFDFSDDQKMLKEQVQKFLSKTCPLTVPRKIMEQGAGDAGDAQFARDAHFARDVWQGLGDLGVIGAAVEESHGGAGLGMLELCVVAEELGKTVAPLPFIATICVMEALKGAGSPEQKNTWLPDLATGKTIGTMAYAEGTTPPTPHNITTHLKDGKLWGKKLPIPYGTLANLALVVAVKDINAKHRQLVLGLVELNQANVTCTPVRTLDPSVPHGVIDFEGAKVIQLGEGAPQSHETLLESIINKASVLTAFEQLGGASACLDMARSYALERFAFGRAIASYQAIKHRLADMYIKNELARSNSYYAAMALADDGADLPLAAAAARISASEAYRFAAQENIQVHGGIGYTWESDCQLFYRRSKLLALSLGSPSQWKDTLVAHLELRNTSPS